MTMSTAAVDRAGTGWLGDNAAAMVLSFDVDAESCVLAEGGQYASHLGALSHQQFGPRVGVPRILDLLDDYQLQATFFVPGRTADDWPDVISEIAARGHEVAAHSHSHHLLTTMNESQEREDIERSLESLSRLDIKPLGHRCPMGSPTARTAGLLVEYGFFYESTRMDDDRPYRIDIGGRELVELPISWLVDDFPQYAFMPDPPLGQSIEPPRKALEVWLSELTAMRRYGCLFTLVNHPFLIGRPSRLQALRQLIEAAIGFEDVWIATGLETARRVSADKNTPLQPEPKAHRGANESPKIDSLRRNLQ